MQDAAVEVDYLIIGAGAVGMAFVDTLLAETAATIAIVDRRDRPGGHWNDAYPFVRLHQPAEFYGVNSYPLGSGVKDEVGFNKGLHHLASGHEVMSHFDQVMQERFLPSGRVAYFPMSNFADDSTITSFLSGQRREVTARKVVDCTHSMISVPSTHLPQFGVASGVSLVPPNDLPRRAGAHAAYVVIGAGKTGIDTCLWLLENGADPDTIHWIMPRDPWLLNRANFQPGQEFLERAAQSLADQVEALAKGDSIDDVFARLEAVDEVWRIDRTVAPTAYHCATVSDGELEQLRRIEHVVRLGRVKRVGAGEIVLEQGVMSTETDWLHIDCSAIGIPRRPSKPVFDGDRITPQFVRVCQPAFSAALIGYVEAVFDNDDEKNRVCAPIPPPNVPSDFLRMMSVELANRYCWSKIPEIQGWLERSRLDGFVKRVSSLTGTETAVLAHFQRYREHVGPAVKNLRQLLPE